MRPLKRPMFRTGGPIKEGLMNGLKDGGPATYMADATMMAGGGMPNMRGRVTGPGGYAGDKVGFFRKAFDPRKSAGASLLRRGNALSNDILTLIMGAGMLPMKEGGIASLSNRPGYNIGKRVVSKVPFLSNIYDKGIRNIKKMMPTFRKQPGQVTGGDIGTRQKYMTQTMPKVPFSQRVKAFATENPYFTGITLPFGISAGLNVGKGVVDTAPGVIERVVKQATDLAVPDFIFDQDKYFAEKEANKKLLEEAKKKKERAGDNVPDAVKDPPKLSKEELDKKKLDRIYKLLGVKRAQADAASKALIDMSRYIDEGGKDVISKKNIGSTISKAISAFDKRLDKADQLKEAAGLMVAKGIANEGDIDKKYKQVMIDAKLRELNPTVLDQKALLDVKGQTLTHDRTKTIARRSFPNAIVLADASDAKDAGVGDTITAEDFVKKQIETQGGDVAGVYIVDKSVIQVDAKGNTKQLL